jgi:hypothetical protein
MALINLFNLLPVVPLDGGRVLKSITCSIGSRIGLVAVIAGMLLATAARRTQAANLTSSPQRSEGSSRKPDLACYVKAPRSQPSARCGKSTFSPRSRAPDSPRRDTDLGESGVRAPRQAIC